MKNLTSAQVRQSFLDFFRNKKHLVVPSASLIPHDDPTLMFNNAGMNQFKESFLGLTPPPAPRVADAQKCMRVSGKHNDLEDVGPSPYHHTFFEMLGNWSFGDYYKREAIAWAWELLTEVWGFPGERLYATVFKDDYGRINPDEEAFGYWQSETDIDPSHILYFGRKDNFWEMGETGPCGPCSEIHFDRGPAFCDKADVPGHTCQVNGDCHRFLEVWNLVFIQYNSLGEGELEPLPAQHVDTGMGFERVVMMMQGGASNYDTDLFTPIFARIQDLAGHTEEQVQEHITPYRVIADHGRAAAFLIGDGARPENTGRGYVLRMIIRRAARFGRKLGFTRPFLAQVAEAVMDVMGGHYRELLDRREHILITLTQEEERFLKTLDLGLEHLDEVLSHSPETVSGRDAFDLYATYGLPLEITRDVAAEHDVQVDEEGFKAALDEHRQVSGGGPLGSFGEGLSAYADLLETLKAEGGLGPDGVEQDPYERTEAETPVAAILRDGQRVETAQPGDKVEIILPFTPFYVEAGGQVSDTGYIVSYAHETEDGSAKEESPLAWQVRIDDTRAPLPGLILHGGEVIEGVPREGDAAWAVVDYMRRMDIARNHTATHLLHSELRYHLGNHVQQAGSLVAPDRLRFDFTHPAMLTQEELRAITESVNDAILANYPVRTGIEAYDKAMERGVTALFGEKYGDTVRVLSIGMPDEPFSQELCGGTHVHTTGEIGLFQIVSEGSVGAGLRRIEAVTGRRAQNLVSEQLQTLEKAAAYLNTQPTEVDRKVLTLMDELHDVQKELKQVQQQLAHSEFESLLAQVEQISGAAVLAAQVQVEGVDTLREMTDWFRDRVPSGVAVLGTVVEGRPQLVAAVTRDLVERGLEAGQLIRQVAKVVGGGGGGRPTLAQAGGRDPDRLGEALASVPGLVREALTE